MWDLLDAVADVLFLLSATGVVAFVALYATRSRWHATPAGRVTLGFMAVVAAIMVSAIVFGLWGGHDRERLVVRVILYALLFSGIIHFNVVLWRAQRADRRGTQGRHRPPT